MEDRRIVNLLGNEYEILEPGDEVVYEDKHYRVSHLVGYDKQETQMVALVRMADYRSNRKIKPSINVHATDCKILKQVDE